MRICDGCRSEKDVRRMKIYLDGVIQWCIYGADGDGIDLCGECRSGLHHAAIALFESKKPTATQLLSESVDRSRETGTDIQSSP